MPVICDLADPRWERLRHRAHRGSDGEVINERVPGAPSIKIVNLQGNVGRLSLTNGIGNRNRDDDYGAKVTRIKLQRGVLLYGRCPQTVTESRDWLPEQLRDRSPCKVAADGESRIDEMHACACVEEMIQRRRAVNDERMLSNERRRESTLSKQAQAAEAVISSLPQILDGLKAANGNTAPAAPVPAPAAKEPTRK